MIPNSSLIVSPTEPTGANRKKVWMKKGKNLFNKNNIENILYSNGAIVANQTSWGLSEFIEVSGSTKYTMSSTLISGQTVGQIQVNEFDENKNYNSDTFLNVTTLEFTTKSNTKYLRVAYRIDRQENVMLEQGSKTSYEPYVEPQIYIKNSNDVYEEFIKKDDIAKVNIVSAKKGYTLISQDIFKQGKHYWGYVIIKKDSGVFDANDYNVADINIKSSSNAINSACYLTDDVWASKRVGYLYVRQYNSKTGAYPFVIVKDTNNSNLNYAKFFIDMIED